MSDIFISYASADRERARLLADALTEGGYSVWWDRTIPPGRVFDEVIQEAIQGARCMIVLWSADSVRSNWVKTEAAEGVARGILVPALVGDIAPPIEFKRIQSANLTDWNGNPAKSEYRNLLESVERLIKQAPRVAGDAASPVQMRRPIAGVATGYGAAKIFGMGAIFTLLVVGAFWLYGKLSQEPAEKRAATDATASVSAPAKIRADSPDAAKAASTNATNATTAQNQSTPRGRVNLLSRDHGGQLLVASTDKWNLLIDGKEDTYVWTETGFGVFGFRDGKAAVIDTFTLFVPSQDDNNMKEFELFAGNASPTGPFESIGKFSTQNMRMMQKPYQEFRFAPVKAKYFKLQSLRSHADRTTSLAYEIQLFGEL
ncbi:MAG TPA: toll/interleukin-1 receptor domain-containing protein, partial [Burkholderiales bacterium]|nr:toll/interleukin-1 receptor domain-containing protein [Burkholderiales bacterium]